MDEPDPYELLQVHPKASPAVIKKAYRALMLDQGAHPDAGGEAGLAAQLSAAYELLMDPKRRAAYDLQRAQAAPPDGPSESPSVVVPCAHCGRRNRVRQLERLEQARCQACKQPLVGPGSKAEGLPPKEAPLGASAPPPQAPVAPGLGQIVVESLQALWEVGSAAAIAGARGLGPRAEAWLKARLRPPGAWPRLAWRPPARLGGLSWPQWAIALGVGLGAALAMAQLAQPPGVEQRLAQAQAAQAQGDRAGQRRALEQGLEAHPGAAPLAEALGRLRLGEGDAEGAIAPLREALAQKLDDPGLATLLADALRSSGRPDEAELRYREVLRQHPEHPEARFGLALVLAVRGRWSEASAELKAAAALRPDPTILHHLSLALAREGRPREALAAQEAALRLAPGRRELRLRALELALASGDKAKAIAQLEALKGSPPAGANEAVALAEAWGRVGRPQEAKEAWRQALKQPGLGSEARARGEALLQVKP